MTWRMHGRALGTGIMAVALASGCATGPQPLQNAGLSNASIPSDKIDVLPFLKLRRNDFQDSRGEYQTPNQIVDLYTRLDVIGFTYEAGDTRGGTASRIPARDYSDEERGWLARYFFGKSISRALVAKSEIVGNGRKIDGTAALLTVNHASNSEEGEKFFTAVSQSLRPAPYFRVSADDIVSVTFELKMSEDVSSQAISVGIDSIRTIAGLVAPQSTIVTRLTNDKINNVASKADETLNKLFARSITEHLVVEAPVSKWHLGKGFEVALKLPRFSGRDIFGKPHKDVGVWAVRLAPPRYSMFSDVVFCAEGERGTADCPSGTNGPQNGLPAAYAALRPSAVLNFGVGENTTLLDHLIKQKTFIESVTILNKDAPQQGARPTAGYERRAQLFCKDIVQALYDLGLNQTDSLAGLWAVTQNAMLSNRAAQALLASDAGVCTHEKNRLAAMGLSLFQ